MSAWTCFATGESHLEQLPKGCSSCHRPHGAPGTAMLEQDKRAMCFVCHGSAPGGVPGDSSIDIETPMSKPFKHEVLATTNPHRFDEVMPEQDAGYDRHVTCEDCHSIHRSTPANPVGWVKGYSSGGTVTRPANFEYEVCYKCHSDSANLPSNQTNKRVQFNLANPSYHPVEGIGKNNDVPSLIPPLTVSDIILCTSCHGNDDVSAGAARGPHGSNYASMLKYYYRTNDQWPESFAEYELCYRCHQRDDGSTGILNDASFQRHQLHVAGSVNNDPTTCKTCHDAHGTPIYAKLIEFDTAPGGPVSAATVGGIQFIDDPLNSGRPRCLLNCHAKEHDHNLFDTLGWP